MKKQIILIVLISTVSISLFGQNFISEDKQWNVRLTGWAGSYSTEIYFIEGDSTLNSLNYKKVWASFDSLLTREYKGLLREELNKVYFLPPDGTEGLLYDFNLEAGDTAYVINQYCTDIPVYVISVDTIDYFGISRKRWVMGEENGQQEYWIEGIGSLFGPLHTNYEFCFVCPVWSLLCYHDGINLEYMMEGETSCYQEEVGIDETEDKEIASIHPNPVYEGGLVTIELSSIPVQLDVMNSAGMLVRNYSSINEQQFFFDTKGFDSGLYFVRLTFEDGLITARKLIIN